MFLYNNVLLIRGNIMKKVFGAIVFCTFFYSYGSEKLTAEQIESTRQSSPNHFRTAQLRDEDRRIRNGYYLQTKVPGAFSPRAGSNTINKDKSTEK